MKAVKIISLIIALAILQFAYAGENNNFVEGHIKFAHNKITHGQIMVKDVVSSCDHVIFKNRNGDLLEYNADELIGYKAGENVYISQQLTSNSNKKVFMKEINIGKIQLYIHYVKGSKTFGVKEKEIFLHNKDYYKSGENVKYAFYIKKSHHSHFLRLHKNKYKEQLLNFFGHKAAWNFVNNEDFNYNKIAYLVEFFNDKRGTKKPMF